MDQQVSPTIDEKPESSHQAGRSPNSRDGSTGVHTAEPQNHDRSAGAQHITQQEPALPPRTEQGQPEPIVPTFFGQIAGTGGKRYETLRERVTKAYKYHTWQYWFVATVANTLMFVQVLVAASLTALGAFNDHRARRGTIFLGAVNTVIAGFLTYFKSRNQPNRARQFRNDLAGIVDQLEDAEANFRNPLYHGDVETVLQEIRDAYAQARKDAQINYPDLWVKGTTARSPNVYPHRQQDPPLDIQVPNAGPVRSKP